MWNRALGEKFNFYFSELFFSIEKKFGRKTETRM